MRACLWAILVCMAVAACSAGRDTNPFAPSVPAIDQSSSDETPQPNGSPSTPQHDTSLDSSTARFASLRLFRHGVLVSETKFDAQRLGLRLSLPRHPRLERRPDNSVGFNLFATAGLIGSWTDDSTGNFYEMTSNGGSSLETIGVTQNGGPYTQSLVTWTPVGDSLEATAVTQRVFDAEGYLQLEAEVPADSWGGGGSYDPPPLQMAPMATNCNYYIRGLTVSLVAIVYYAYWTERNPGRISNWAGLIRSTAMAVAWGTALYICLSGEGPATVSQGQR